MSKCALLAAAGFLGLCVSLSAQEVQPLGQNQPARLTLNQAASDGVVEVPLAKGEARLFSTLNSIYYGPAPLLLADGRLFSFPSAFAWTEAVPADFLPILALAEPPRLTSAAMLASNSASKPVDLLPRFDYVGSEVGVFYGKSTGKYGREVKAGYILSEIVEGDTHISGGMSYQESSGRTPRVIGH